MIKSGSSEEMAKAPLLNASRLEAGAKAGGDGESMAKKVVLVSLWKHPQGLGCPSMSIYGSMV